MRWIEQLFEELERALPEYKRPIDYKERASKLLNKQRKPATKSIKGKYYE